MNQEGLKVGTPEAGGASRLGDGGPAYARPLTVAATGEFSEAQAGLSLRDYFAAKALPALISTGKAGQVLSEDYAAKMAYQYADAMIQARAERSA